MKKPYGLTSPVEPGGQAERVGELQALLARVEGAERGTRAINRDLAVALYKPEPWRPECRPAPNADGCIVITYVNSLGGKRTYGTSTAPDFSRSIDEAVGLVERCKPDWAGLIHLSIAGSGQATIEARDPCDRRSAQAFGHTPALAMCGALLKALLSTEAQPSVCEQGEQGNPVEDEPLSGVRHGRDSQGGER